MKYIILSDLHNHFEKIKFCRNNFPEHKLIVPGDIVNHGTKYEFDRVPKLDYVAPGNHDFGGWGNFYHYECAKQFDKRFGTKFAGKWSRPKIDFIENNMLIGCDSNLETTSIHDFAQGELGWYQRWWLYYYLNAQKYADYIKIVYFHHHPFLRGIQNYPLKMIDANKVMKILAGKVYILGFGHKHKFEHCLIQEEKFNIPFILACGSYKDDYAWQIQIEGQKITVNEVKVVCG